MSNCTLPTAHRLGLAVAVRDGARPQKEGEHEDRPYTPEELASLVEHALLDDLAARSRSV
jgi:hypothetical protein